MIKTSKLFITGLLLVSSHFIFGCKAYSQIRLEYGEFDISFVPKNCNDTLHFDITKNYPAHKLIIYLKDCGGECYFELFNKSKKLVITGYYKNGPDTLTKYRFGKQLGPPFDKKYYEVRLIKYLYPLKKGAWTFYDGKGKVIDKFEYEYKFD